MSSACWCVVMCSFSWCEYTNAHVDSFVVCIVGKMAQDVGWCESVVVFYASSLVGF